MRTAMFNNTMVCLPTGAGKSMIAFVVMYNLLRWCPRGKVVFVAHTRALLHQQQQAYCMGDYPGGTLGTLRIQVR